MAQEQLRQAFALMKQGDKKQAAQIVQSVIKQDRNNVSAWWLMANILDEATRKQKALEKVLSLDANHAGAKKMLASLAGKPAPSSAKNAPSPAPKPSGDNDGRSTIEIEFDWGKLEAREVKQKEVKHGADDHAIRTASIVMGGFAIVIVIILIVFVAIPSVRNGQTATKIEATMTSFLESMVAGEIAEAETFVCEQSHRDQGRANNFALGVRTLYTQFQPDFSELEIEVSDFTEDSAIAQLSGNIMMIPIEGETQTILIDDIMGVEAFNYETTSFEFVLENEQWLICASSFGE